ncbi:hypothetical protein F4604DRAFT_1859738 [Suillus subluteus]|nr:hypothetical protein F4604DRAFT_1859738 [Suillus subluteus]
MAAVHCTAFIFTLCLMSIQSACLGTSYSWTFNATNERVRPVWITNSTISQVDFLMTLNMMRPPSGMKALATAYGSPHAKSYAYPYCSGTSLTHGKSTAWSISYLRGLFQSSLSQPRVAEAALWRFLAIGFGSGCPSFDVVSGAA